MNDSRPHDTFERSEDAWALVPVKALVRSKQRLEPRLGNSRHEFTVAMLKDLLIALDRSEAISKVAVISTDARVKRIGKQYGAMIVDETASGDLNQAVAQGVRAIREAGGDRVAIFPADIPLVSPAEIDMLVRSMRVNGENESSGVIGICPSADHGGTNFLFLETGMDFPFAYGPGSFQSHVEAASGVSDRVLTLSAPGVSLDIDQPEDLDEFISRCEQDSAFQNSESWRFLWNGGFVDRPETRHRMQQ